MEKQFVPYELALKLKELGFHTDICFALYGEDNKIKLEIHSYLLYDKVFISSPLYQQVFDWFRDRHNMLANVYSNASGFLYECHDAAGGTHRFDSGFTGDCEDSGTFTSFQKAQIACLKKLIEMVENLK